MAEHLDTEWPTGGHDQRSEVPLDAVLARSRERISEQSQADGDFLVACKDTGVRPTPVAEARFDSHAAAERARRAAEAYREALRTVDPALATYDLVVSDAHETDVDVTSVRESTRGRRENGLPRARRTATVAGRGTDEWLTVDNAPVVHMAGPDSLLDDEVVARQLQSKL